MRVLLLCALILLIGALPAGANLIAISSTATFIPNIDGYPQDVALSRDFDSATANAIRLAIQAATSAGDTIYVHDGTFADRVATTDWRANDVVLIVNTGSVSWANDSASNYAFDTPLTYTGLKVLGASWAIGAGAFGVSMGDGTASVEFDSCSWSGAGQSALFGEIGADINDVTVNYGTFTMTGNATQIFTRSYANSIAFNNCTFDFSGITASGNTQNIRLAGVHGLTFDSCTFTSPIQSGAGVNDFVSIEGATGYTQGDVEFKNCSFVSQAPTGGGALVTLTFGRASGVATSYVDSVTVQGCVFTGPGNATNVNALKFENPEAAGPSATHDKLRVIGNTFSGYVVTIGMLEGTNGAVVANNKMTNSTYGVALQEAHNVTVANNVIENCTSGMYFDVGENEVRVNWQNVVSGNVIKNCTRAYDIVKGSVFNATRAGGNVLIGNTYVATNDSIGGGTNYSTIATWQAMPVDNLPANWLNGMGDVLAQPGDIDAGLRRAGVFGGGSNQLGVSGKGLIK